MLYDIAKHGTDIFALSGMREPPKMDHLDTRSLIQEKCFRRVGNTLPLGCYEAHNPFSYLHIHLPNLLVF